MGALGNTGDGRIFLNTFKGKFTQRADEKTIGAIKRINKNNVAIWEMQFDTISDVYLQKIEKHDSKDFGFQWNIYLAHAHSDETFKLSLPYSGRLTMGLFLRLPNIDIITPMTFIMYYFVKDNKVALVIHQKDQKVPTYWTQENPGDCPDLEETIRDGKPAWDSAKRMDYLEKYMNDQIHPFLKMDKPATNKVQGAMDNQTPVEFPKQAIATVTVVETSQQAKTVTKAPPPKEQDIPTWDAEGGYLKKEHADNGFCQCDENGKFKRDGNGKLIPALPF